MKADQINDFILGFPEVTTSKPFGAGKLVYTFQEQMFAILDEDKHPVRLSLKCDPRLSKLLREKYEEVMAGDHLDSESWNTIVLTGQLSEDEVQDLIRHSYLLVESGTVTEINEE